MALEDKSCVAVTEWGLGGTGEEMGHPRDCPSRLRGRATFGEEMLKVAGMGWGQSTFLVAWNLSPDV